MGLIMKIRIKLTAVFLLFLLFTACDNGEKKVSLFLYNEEDLFVREFSRQIISLAGELVDLKSFDALNSQILQNETIENQINEGCDLALINPVDRLGAYSIIKRLKNEDIPVIFFNREPLLKDLLLWDKTWYVGARAEQSGQMQADLVMELFGNDPENLNEYDRNRDGRIQTIILKGEQGHQDAEIRTSEVVLSFRLKGFDLDILATEVANWDRDESYEKMGDLIKTFESQIELVLSNNDAMALGAINRMRQSGLFVDSNENGRVDRYDEGWIPVLGIDGIDQAVEQIQEGYLYGTVLNDSATMARAMMELGDAILFEKSLNELSFTIEEGKYIWIDYQVFTLEN
jgi:methyl-galactoside transport system substrate-binding protein